MHASGRLVRLKRSVVTYCLYECKYFSYTRAREWEGEGYLREKGHLAKKIPQESLVNVNLNLRFDCTYLHRYIQSGFFHCCPLVTSCVSLMQNQDEIKENFC